MLFKKELILCNNLEVLTKIGMRLKENDINYKIRIVNNFARNASAFSGEYSTARGVIGLHSDKSKLYYVYVSRREYEKASFMIRFIK